MTALIDAYCHCGISKYKPVEDVLKAQRRVGVGRAVLVQHLGEYDNEYLRGAVQAYPDRFCAVVLIDPRDRQRAQVVDEVVSADDVRGVRVTDQMLAHDLDFCVEIAERKLVLVVHVDEGVGSVVEAITALLGRVAGATVVVSHMGRPRPDRAGVVADRDLFELAHDPRVLVTLSGMSMWCPYPYAAMDGFVQEVISAFGARRTMWGSNYPECGSVSDYERDLALVTDRRWGLTDDQVDEICRRTAQRVWFGVVATAG